jgi:hypothetical protein
MTKHLVWFAVVLLVLFFGHVNGQHMKRQYQTEISRKEDVIKGLREDKAALYVCLTAALFQTAGHKMSFEEINNASVIYCADHREWADLAFRTDLIWSQVKGELDQPWL